MIGRQTWDLVVPVRHVGSRRIALATLLCLFNIAHADDEQPNAARKAQPLTGLWAGVWGGGEVDGVVFQPVNCEVAIRGNQIELFGLRNGQRISGTFRVDEKAKKIVIAPSVKQGDPAQKPVEYTYQLGKDDLTLIDSDKFPILLQRRDSALTGPANATVEFVQANELTEAGELSVTQFTALQTNHPGAEFLSAVTQNMILKKPVILLVQENDCKTLTLAAARERITKPTLVALTYRKITSPLADSGHELWKQVGPPSPLSDAVRETLSKTLRPGTLVFIVSGIEQMPVP